MNNIYIEGELPEDCLDCPCESEYYCNLLFEDIGCLDVGERHKDCPLQLLSTRLAEERKIVCNQARVDIRSLFNSYASSLIDYCIWNKKADENYKLYNNFKRIINDRLDKVLDLFDKRIDQIERDE